MKKIDIKKGIYNGIIRKTAINKDSIYIEIVCPRDNQKSIGGAFYLDLTSSNIKKFIEVFECTWEELYGKYCRVKVNKNKKIVKVGHIVGDCWFSLKETDKLNIKVKE